MAAVAVALAVGVVLVDDDLAGLLARGPRRLGELVVRRVDADADDLLGGAVPTDGFEGGRRLGVGDLRMGVVDVVPRAVGEHGVDERRLQFRHHRLVEVEATGVVAGLLVVEVPAGARGAAIGERRHEGVDQQRRRRHRVGLAAADHDAVLGLDPADLRQRHSADVIPDARHPSRTLRARRRKPPSSTLCADSASARAAQTQMRSSASVVATAVSHVGHHGRSTSGVPQVP